MATTDYTYDTINRLSSLIHKQGSTTLAGYDYTYDGLSRPTSIDSETDGVSTFTYDATSQLTAADHSSQTDETYAFDANGNRNSSGFSTGTNNQTTESPDFTYTYDDEGNRTSRTETATGAVTEYSWDYRNRLTAVKDRATSGGSVVKQVDYEYDAFNRLVKRTYDADGAGSGSATNQYWVYDEGINAVLRFEGSGASNVSHRYLWTNEVDELIADEQIGSDTLYGLRDHLGTIRDIANFNEGTSVTSVTNHRKYSAFGKLVSESNTAVDLIFGFTGKQLDEATGMQHNLNRWYDSDLGQWQSEDPIGFNAGDENLRRYVGNGSVGRIDQDGLTWSEYWTAFGQSYVDFVNPWNGSPPPVDGIDSVLSWGTMGGQVVGATAGAAVVGVAAGTAIGTAAAVEIGITLPTIGGGSGVVLVGGGTAAVAGTTTVTISGSTAVVVGVGAGLILTSAGQGGGGGQGGDGYPDEYLDIVKDTRYWIKKLEDAYDEHMGQGNTEILTEINRQLILARKTLETALKNLDDSF